MPKQLRERLSAELDKRLDLDIDEIFTSPKLRLQLSPAELDKSLLELYNKVVEGPSGDVFRVIGGGGPVGLQNMYMKRQAARKTRKQLVKGEDVLLDLLPTYVGEASDKGETTAAQSVRRALSRNLPANGRKNDTPSMCGFGCVQSSSHVPQSWSGLRAPPKRSSNKFSLLI